MVRVEPDFIVYGSYATLEEALTLCKSLIERKGGFPHKLYVGESLRFVCHGRESFSLTSQEGFSHLRKNKSFLKKVKRALGDSLETISKDLD